MKAMRLQAWAPARGGPRVGHRPPPFKNKKIFWLHWGFFCYIFLIFGGLSPCKSLFTTFYFMMGDFFWTCRPTPPTKSSAGAHDCKEGSRAFSPEILLYDRNLVCSGHVLLRFCLKSDKNIDKL